MLLKCIGQSTDNIPIGHYAVYKNLALVGCDSGDLFPKRTRCEWRSQTKSKVGLQLERKLLRF